MQILNFKRVGFGYPGQALILSGVNFAIAPGDRIVALGSNGSGKSTLAFLASGILKPVTGEVERCGQQGEMLRVGIVFQNSRMQMVGTTVEEDLAFGLSVLNYSSSQMRSRVAEFLREFGLETKKNYSASQLSGGELRRLALAAVLITEPELLILDEPLGMLDSYNKAVFLYYLQHRIPSQMAVLWLDHDLRSVRYGSQYFLIAGQQLQQASISDLNNPKTLEGSGLEPAPLQPLEWRFPERVSRSIYGPEQIQFDECEN